MRKWLILFVVLGILGAAYYLYAADGDPVVEGTTPSFTGVDMPASATPGWAAKDSTAEATGTFEISIDSLTAGQPSQIILKVDEDGGEDVTYLTIDGDDEWIKAAKPIQAPLTSNSDADGMSQAEMTTAGMYGTTFWATGAGTWNLPAAVADMHFCIYSTTAAAVIVNPDDADVLVYEGTADTAGHQIASASGAGDFICFKAIDGTNWHSFEHQATWVPGS